MPKPLNAFSKVLNASHTVEPRVITVDKNAAYPPAITELKADEALPETTETRQSKYLNNTVEQDHRFIKRRVKPGLGFGSFNTARRTLKGYEAMNMIRKGQIEGADKRRCHGTDLIHQRNLWSRCVIERV